jgi:energy-coupling factor transporter ATP-binding protein EcfA2
MKDIHIKDLGPIQKADIKFGDLTLLVGPQASGKSIFLQLLKLLVDKKHIRKVLEQYGFPWKNDVSSICELYFGNGMKNIWSESTRVILDTTLYSRSFLLPRQRESITNAEEKVFYIPAQRVLCLENGWPRFFSGFDGSVPYILRHYSETLRLFMDKGMDKREDVFPAKKRLKEPLREAFNNAIYQGGKIKLDVIQGRKQFMLEIGDSKLPFMSWSAGQKEFMPLLLSFYYLSPPAKVSTKDDLKIVVIEEPEMGLHPQAIKSILLEVIDLMARGYQVIISTHSPVLLEFAWAFKMIKESNQSSYKNMMELFDIRSGPPSLINMFTKLMDKKITSFYFDRKDSSVIVKDISSLDAGSSDIAVSEWGGLSSFSTKASEIILKAGSDE